MTEPPPSKIILASSSPRRRQLLSEAGYQFEVVPPGINESAFDSARLSARRFAEKLALAKANSVAERFADYVVIGADTVVDSNARIIGKASDAEDARRIITRLFSAPHKVITALAVIRKSDGVEMVESDVTVVYPRQLTTEQIDEHISSGLWVDKAGAYAIQENGDRFIERIDGSLTNVMGLPMELLGRMLEAIR